MLLVFFMNQVKTEWESNIQINKTNSFLNGLRTNGGNFLTR